MKIREKNNKLSPSFYINSDVVLMAKRLLGMYLCSYIDGYLTAGKIVECEAYCGFNDKASHSYGGRKTKRNAVMYQTGGIAYVYLCYGIHYLFNVVTNKANCADAVLIRAIEPISGIQKMCERRNMKCLNPQLTSGPGRLSQALGITTEYNGTKLWGNKIWIKNSQNSIPEKEIYASKRIGIDYAGEDSLRLWRFYLLSNHYVSCI